MTTNLSDDNILFGVRILASIQADEESDERLLSQEPTARGDRSERTEGQNMTDMTPGDPGICL